MIHVFNTHPFSYYYPGKRKWGWLVNWIEKAGLENIERILEITEAEHNHKLLLTVNNLQDLDAYAFP